jgi:hypothetical protein
VAENAPVTDENLKENILYSLRCQGFRIEGDRILPPSGLDKEQIRALHSSAVQHRRARAKDSLARHEAKLLARLAHGQEVVPERITPALVEVQPDSEDEVLFRYVSLHWSVPVSSGYGRRLRFLVIDEQNGKLIGLIGLGDPVFSLAARDNWIGWGKTERRARLHHVMDAFCLGAVPPYSFVPMTVSGSRRLAACTAPSAARTLGYDLWMCWHWPAGGGSGAGRRR